MIEILGTHKVAARALAFATLVARYQRVLVNGTAGIVALGANGAVMSVLAFSVVGSKIAEFYVLADATRLDRLPLSNSLLNTRPSRALLEQV